MLTMAPTLITDRLRIFDLPLQLGPPEWQDPKRVFVAALADEDWPGVVATMVVMLDGAGFVQGEHAWIDWLEVSSEWRRQGIGREFVKAVRTLLGKPLYGDPIGESDDDPTVLFAHETGVDRWSLKISPEVSR